MHDLLMFISDWWLVAVIGLLACCGLGTGAGEVANGVRKWLLGDLPKPRQYRVTVEDYDGWPIRSYKLPADAVGRLLRNLERDKYDKAD